VIVGSNQTTSYGAKLRERTSDTPTPTEKRSTRGLQYFWQYQADGLASYSFECCDSTLEFERA
jgi:hypothetical protein